MRTRERVTLAMLVVAGVVAAVFVGAVLVSAVFGSGLASAGPRAQAVLTVAAVTLLAVLLTLIRLDRTGSATKSGISAGHPAAAGVSAHRSPVTVRRKPDWDSARGVPRPHAAGPSPDGGSFSLAAGASPHPTE